MPGLEDKLKELQETIAGKLRHLPTEIMRKRKLYSYNLIKGKKELEAIHLVSSRASTSNSFE